MASTVENRSEDAIRLTERLVSGASPRRRGWSWASALAYVLLSIGAVVMIVPFLWMVFTSLKTAPELLEYTFLPKAPTLENYAKVLNTSDFERWYFNSLLIAAFTTLSVAIFDSLAGYTLNKFNFPGKNIIFLGILGTLMIPTEMLVIPWYTMSVQWGWHIGLAQYWGIAFPGVITAAGIFLMRQFFDGVPDELLDAARIDGMNELGIWWRIAMPLVKPAIAALCIFNFWVTGTPTCGR
ncbi:MAG: carbohydrate ABC transporter permease [Caldilineaceae bacterium]